MPERYIGARLSHTRDEITIPALIDALGKHSTLDAYERVQDIYISIYTLSFSLVLRNDRVRHSGEWRQLSGGRRGGREEPRGGGGGAQ